MFLVVLTRNIENFKRITTLICHVTCPANFKRADLVIIQDNAALLLSLGLTICAIKVLKPNI